MWAATARAGVVPVAELALARTEVFAGEDPGLVVTVTAPASGEVSVVKSDRAHLGFLRADLIGPDGRRVPGGIPHARRRDEPDDFTRLAAGRSVTLYGDVVAQPPMPGEYRVDVSFRPTPDRSYVVRKQFKLNSRLLIAQDIVNWSTVGVPDDDPRGRDRTVDILVVQTGKTRTLFYRRVGPEGSLRLQRLWPVVEPDKLTTKVDGYDRGRVAGTIKITYEDDGNPVTAEVDYWTGAVVKPPPVAVAPPPRPRP